MLQRYFGLACLALFAGVLLLGGCATLHCEDTICTATEMAADDKLQVEPLNYVAIFGEQRVGAVTSDGKP